MDSIREGIKKELANFNNENASERYKSICKLRDYQYTRDWGKIPEFTYLETIEAFTKMLSDEEKIANTAERVLIAIGVPAINPLITDIGSEKDVIRQRAMSALDHIYRANFYGEKKLSNPEKLIHALINLLGDKADIADKARELLASFGKEITTELIQLLQSDIYEIRERAINLRGRTGDRKLVPILLTLLKEKKPISYEAICALGYLGDLRAAPTILELLRQVGVPDRNKSYKANLLSYACCHAFGRMQITELRDYERSERISLLSQIRDRINNGIILSADGIIDYSLFLLADILNEIGELNYFYDSAFIETLTELLLVKERYGDEMSIASKVERLLVLIGKPALIPLVRSLINTIDSPLCDDYTLAAVQELFQKYITYQDPRTKEALNAASRNTEARFFLLFIATPPTMPLFLALKSDDLSVRERAAFELGEIKDKGAVPILIETLTDNSKPISREAIEALRKLPDIRAIPILFQVRRQIKETNHALSELETLCTQTVDVISWAEFKTLNKIERDFVLTELIDSLKDERRGWWAIKALGEIGDKRAIVPLVECFSLRRNDAAEALMKIGKPATGALIQGLKHESDWVREDCAWVLGKAKETIAVPALVDTMLNDSDPQVLHATLYALIQIEDPFAVRSFVKLVTSKLHFVSLDLTDKIFAFIDKFSLKSNSDVEYDVNSFLHSQDANSALSASQSDFGILIISLLNYIRSSLLSPTNTELKKSFGDYGALIRKLCTVERQVATYSRGEYISYKFDMTSSDTALNSLCLIKTHTTNNLLHLVAKRLDLLVFGGDYCGSYYYKMLSFEHQRMLAKKELESRGNPSYDSLYYREKNAWTAPLYIRLFKRRLIA